jgi:hypothetical protein
MKSDVRRSAMVLSLGFTWGLAGAVSFVAPTFAVPQPLQDAAPQEGPGQGPGDGRMPLLGKITGVHNTSLDVADTNGETVAVKLTGQTQYRKDRQAAKRTDFKIGDIILVRGEENPDHSWTAQIVAARSMNGGPNGRGDPGGSGGGARGLAQAGTLGKDYVAGEIKSIDAPKLSVLRSDKVTQSIELNEETSLRKGRDSITMADVQVGDHLFARGAEQNGVFVPKMVMVIGPEQWKRMQELGAQARGESGRQRRQQPASGDPSPAAPVPPASPGSTPTPAPPEPQH